MEEEEGSTIKKKQDTRINEGRKEENRKIKKSVLCVIINIGAFVSNTILPAYICPSA
jgi:predicted histidine transporter YuiF (NhaC family)